jgi:hypothetical protein
LSGMSHRLFLNPSEYIAIIHQQKSPPFEDALLSND